MTRKVLLQNEGKKEIKSHHIAKIFTWLAKNDICNSYKIPFY